LKDLEYEERLKVLKIPSMCNRRVRGDLIEVYKFTHGVYNCKNPLELNQQSTTRGHCYKLKKNACKTSLRQHFFINRVVGTWNALDKSTVEASTLNSFKNRIDNEFKDYMYCAKVSHPVLPHKPHMPLSAIYTQPEEKSRQ
jgi:hypothetical protein